MPAVTDAACYRFEVLEGGLGLLTFDQPGSKVNTLGTRSLLELSRIVAELHDRKDLSGLLFRSGKPGQFVAGADLKELAALVGVPRSQVKELIDMGHSVFTRLTELPFPTVALIDGPCLGGGAELALAMDARLMSEGATTSFGFPEVKVGMIPAWGGTQRLPRQTSLSLALDLIIKGRVMDVAESVAQKVGSLVPSSELLDTARRTVESFQTSGSWRPERLRRGAPVEISAEDATRLFRETETSLAQADEAALLALEAIRLGHDLPLSQALSREADVALRALGTPAAAQRIAEFFGRIRKPGTASSS